MRVQLLLTCLCDAFYGEVGIASVRVLEHLGCEVAFPKEQTCCGQPPFNAGDWASARAIAERCAGVFQEDLPIVTPSASCAAMLAEGYPMLGLDAPQVFELCQFIDEVAKPSSWPSLPSPVRAVFHRSCHGRMLHLGAVQERVLGLVPNLTLEPIEDADQCCGFGGAFSVTHGGTSVAIGSAKLDALGAPTPERVVSGDAGCLMHLDGLSARSGRVLKFSHVAEILAEAL
ncbi:MAG: (Fe-S)-binding protein [Armatimonadetes bacterium]|nr:(Fe-S)-binding protein [Armatimonadota bacterium]